MKGSVSGGKKMVDCLRLAREMMRILDTTIRDCFRNRLETFFNLTFLEECIVHCSD